MSGVGSRRTSALFDDRRERNHHPMSPSARSREPILTPDLFDLADIPALATFPGMASSIPTTTTMSSLVSGGPSSQRQIPVTKGRRNSLSRNDLSMTMDRMALGGRMDPEGGYYPLEYGRMRAAYWMECLLTHQIPEEEYVPRLSPFSHVNPSLGSVPVIGVKYQCPYSTTVSMASSLVASFPSVSL
jgi:anaphase-promoting complex subunit 1